MKSGKRKWMSRLRVAQALGLVLMAAPLVYAVTPAPQEAPAPEGDDGFLLKTNGFEPQEQFGDDRNAFSAADKIGTGLGPTYNAQSCSDCHQNPVTGAGSQVVELRAGRFDGTNYSNHPGGSLIQNRAINSNIQEFVAANDNVRAFRLSLSTLGDGYIEAIPDDDIRAVRDAQPAAMRGQALLVPILEASAGTTRVGRFGWKSQHASLLSFSADAYLNEIGITSPLFPDENTSSGNSVAAFDQVADPEDGPVAGAPFGEDIHAFTRFMRSTKVPSAVIPNATNGGDVFIAVGCETCHHATFITAPPGTVLHDQYTVPDALGSRIIHPYSDFLLHDVGTGDGIAQGGQSTRNKIRTPPLWGLRARNLLMHDGAAITREEAILRHGGDAAGAVANYQSLSQTDKNRLLSFLSIL